MQVGNEEQISAAGADLRVARLQRHDLGAQSRVGDVDDAVVLAVHPRGSLAGAIDNGLHICFGQAEAGFEMAVGAVLAYGFDGVLHGGFR